jgi:hypothetical protein
MLVGVGGGGVPIRKVALLFREFAVALMSTYIFTALAVKVTVATPEESVIAVTADNAPAEELLTENETE